MDKPDSIEKNDLSYRVYLDERKSLVDAEREQSRLFDKAILTLAGGAFGLSLTFIKEIISSDSPVQIWWLIFAWIGFSLSMLSTLISFLTSQKACSTQRATLEAAYFPTHPQQHGKSQRRNSAALWTSFLNVFSIFTFIIGTVFLSIFSIVNLVV